MVERYLAAQLSGNVRHLRRKEFVWRRETKPVNRWRAVSSTIAIALGVWRFGSAAEQWRLWRIWRATDPSAADLYHTNALFHLGTSLAAFVLAAVILRMGRPSQRTAERQGAERAGAHRLWIAVVLGVALGSALHIGVRWLRVDRCLDSGGAWDHATLVCLRR